MKIRGVIIVITIIAIFTLSIRQRQMTNFKDRNFIIIIIIISLVLMVWGYPALAHALSQRELLSSGTSSVFNLINPR